jgi:hypothetical protein
LYFWSQTWHADGIKLSARMYVKLAVQMDHLH